MDEIATLNDEIGTLKAQLVEVIQVQGVAAAEEAARAVDKEEAGKEEVEALTVEVGKLKNAVKALEEKTTASASLLKEEQSMAEEAREGFRRYWRS